MVQPARRCADGGALYCGAVGFEVRHFQCHLQEQVGLAGHFAWTGSGLVPTRGFPRGFSPLTFHKFPNAKIHKSTKEKEGGTVVYDLEFTQKGRKFEADVKLDGTIVNWEKEIAAKDLPETVKKSVEEKYPKSSLKEIMEVTAVKGG